MPDGDLVAEEPGRACAGVGDQGLLLAEFQREVFTQELSEAGFDLLCFGLGSDESQEMVIALCRTLDYAECDGEGAGQRRLMRSGTRHNPGHMSEASFVGPRFQRRRQRKPATRR